MVNGLITFPELIARSGRTRWQINRLRDAYPQLMPEPQRIGGALFWPPESIQAVQALCDELSNKVQKG